MARLSIDGPSGLDSDTGQPRAMAPPAASAAVIGLWAGFWQDSAMALVGEQQHPLSLPTLFCPAWGGGELGPLEL